MPFILELIILLAIIVTIAKSFEYFTEKKAEREAMKKEVERQRVENLRLKSMITGKCPECEKEKSEELICSCGFTYVDGSHCYGCGKFFPYENLDRCFHPVYPYAFACKKCTGS